MENKLCCHSKGGQSAFFLLLLFQQVALDVHQCPLVSCSTGRSQSVLGEKKASSVLKEMLLS